MAIKNKGEKTDTPSSTIKAPKKAVKSTKRRLPTVKVPRPLRSVAGYFIGAWREIKQVRWQSRKATWKSTLAVLLFTSFWMAVVLAVDLLFQNLLNNILA